MPRIHHSPPHLDGRERQLVLDALAQNWVAPGGPHVDEFERGLADYVGAGVVATASGTAALHLAFRLLDVRPGDLVLCSSFTWVASVAPAIYMGAEAAFVDSEPDTWNMSPAALRRALQEARTGGRVPKAVVVVQVYGQTADMDPILALCREHGVPVVEDAAESLGATYHGQQSGTFGRFGIFSFNGNKIITTSAGGALVSADPEMLDRARYLAGQARLPVRHHEHAELGYNYRMSNLCAAVGVGQLEALEVRVAARRAIYHEYRRRLGGLPGLAFMPECGHGRATHWMTAVTLDPASSPVTRDELLDALAADDIEPRPVWMPQHRQPVMRECRFHPHQPGEDVAGRIFDTGLCLPSGSSLTAQEMDRVVACVRRAFATGGEPRPAGRRRGRAAAALPGAV